MLFGAPGEKYVFFVRFFALSCRRAARTQALTLCFWISSRMFILERMCYLFLSVYLNMSPFIRVDFFEVFSQNSAHQPGQVAEM